MASDYDDAMRRAQGARVIGLRDSANAMLDGAHTDEAWRRFARRVVETIDVLHPRAALGGSVPSPDKPGCHDGPVELGTPAPPRMIYTASKTKHAAMWRELRDEGVPIISTWIDEAGVGETHDRTDLWRRCVSEATCCTALILYAEAEDVVRGALVEVGVALAHNRPVIVFGSAPRWTFEDHPRVVRVETKEQAVRAALRGASSPAPEPTESR